MKAKDGVPGVSFRSGLLRAAQGLPRASTGEEKKRFYGFTDLRGRRRGRGGCSRGTANQVIAGFRVVEGAECTDY